MRSTRLSFDVLSAMTSMFPRKVTSTWTSSEQCVNN